MKPPYPGDWLDLTKTPTVEWFSLCSSYKGGAPYEDETDVAYILRLLDVSSSFYACYRESMEKMVIV